MATFRATVNHIKGEGSESMHSVGGGASQATPPRIGIGLKYIFIDQFFNASSLKKNRLLILIVMALRLNKRPKKKVKL